MKRLSLSLFILFSFFAPEVSASMIKVNPKIDEVTVFSDRARITRTASVDLPSGDSIIEIDGLSASIDTDSIRVEGEGRFQIGAIEIKQEVTAALIQDKERELNKKVEQLEDQMVVLQGEIEAIAKAKLFIDSLGKVSSQNVERELKTGDIKPDSWEKAWQQVYKGNAALSKDEVAKKRKLAEVRNDISRYRQEIRTIYTGQKSTLRVRINVAAKAETNGEIILKYLMDNASWRPVYDIRLDTQDKKVSIVQYGAIQQSTGEDWKNAAVTLSTARPQVGTEMPTLGTNWIDFIPELPQPAPMAKMFDRRRAVQASMAVNREMVLEESVELDEKLEQADVQESEAISSEYMAEFKIPGRISVASDGTVQKFRVGSHDVKAELAAQASPKLDTSAYLSAKMIYTGETPLLPGVATLFRDDFLVGNSYLPLVRTGEKHVAFFGVDDKIVIKRNVMAEEKGTSGVIAKDERLTRKYKTEIQNLHAMPMRIAIFDQVPVAMNSDIVIKIDTKETTAGYEADTEDVKGVLKWAGEYKPKEKKTITFSYTVTYPKDKKVTGF